MNDCLIFAFYSKNLKNNGKYWNNGNSSEILCIGSSGSIGWALSLSLSLGSASAYGQHYLYLIFCHLEKAFIK
jgi:hypothetical protein